MKNPTFGWPRVTTDLCLNIEESLCYYITYFEKIHGQEGEAIKAGEMLKLELDDDSGGIKPIKIKFINGFSNRKESEFFKWIVSSMEKDISERTDYKNLTLTYSNKGKDVTRRIIHARPLGYTITHSNYLGEVFIEVLELEIESYF